MNSSRSMSLDARGGAALSVRQITGQPILFMGTGEKTDALEVFQADRVASRILGMGDVLALVENVTKTVDREQAEKLARKLKKGKDFDLEDLHDQLLQVERMGGLTALMDTHPLIGDVRGRGLMIGVELVKDRHTKARAAEERGRVVQEMFKRGVLILGGETHWPVQPLLLVIAHLPIAVVEGVILGFVVGYLAKVKPEMLRPLAA